MIIRKEIFCFLLRHIHSQKRRKECRKIHRHASLYKGISMAAASSESMAFAILDVKTSQTKKGQTVMKN